MEKHEPINEEAPPDCPQCGKELKTLLFMGVDPEFYVCDVCHIAYDLKTLKPMAQFFDLFLG